MVVEDPVYCACGKPEKTLYPERVTLRKLLWRSPEMVLLPPLHIKLKSVKNFVKDLGIKGENYPYLRIIFQISVMPNLNKEYLSA
jgi:hypothetical protein